MVSNHTFSEGDLPTSIAEDGTRTFDTGTPAAEDTRIEGPVTGDLLLNRFVLHQCLARSRARCVFRALDQRRRATGDANPWVVLKVVTAAPGQQPRALLTLRREAAISQGLEHPNLPWIRGLDRDGPHTFLCLAWIPGESLATILDQRGPVPMLPLQALNIVAGIGRALTYLHGLGITHADVKPANILVGADGNATLLDLGVALGPDNGDRVAAYGFTPQYASPEVLNGALPTPADDLFSLACVVYRMLTGRRPFGEANASEAAANGERPARPDNLSEAQWRGLDRALAWCRADRQHDVQSFLAQLGGSQTEPVAAIDRAADPIAEPTAYEDADPVAQPVDDPVDDPVADPVADAGPARAAGAVLPAGNRQWNLGRWWPMAALVAVALAVATLFLNPQPVPPPAAGDGTGGAGKPAEPVEPVAVKRPSGKSATPVAARPRPEAPRPRPGISSPDQVDPSRTGPQQPERAPGDSPAPETESPVAEPAAAGLLPSAPAATPDTSAPPAAGKQRVSLSELKIRRYVEPRYPRNALTRRVAGWVEVDFTVDASGRTRDVRVSDADPPGIFEDAALAAVTRWRFDTAGSSAMATPIHSEVRLRFMPQ